jgi:hypothetical protein
MFWSRSACTLDGVTRAWLEARWEWLTREFGGELLAAPTILPTNEFFPDRYDRSEAAVCLLVNRVCGYMRVDPGLVDLESYSENRRLDLVNDAGHRIGGTAGTYHSEGDRAHIRLARDQFDEPATLVGTIAHELAHMRLLGERRLPRGVVDNELVTDLTVVFHGLGVFLANCPRHWDSDLSHWPGTNVLKPEYMTTPMFGYALALRCRRRQEARPAWRRHLKPGVRAEFEQSLRFLEREARA